MKPDIQCAMKSSQITRTICALLVFILMVACFLPVSGCAKKETVSETEAPDVSVAENNDSEKSEKSAAENEDSDKETGDGEETEEFEVDIAKYLVRYDIDTYFTDMTVSFRFLLINDSDVYLLTVISEDVETITSIHRDDISGMDVNTVADMATIKINDISGGSITMIASPEDAHEIEKILK